MQETFDNFEWGTDRMISFSPAGYWYALILDDDENETVFAIPVAGWGIVRGYDSNKEHLNDKVVGYCYIEGHCLERPDYYYGDGFLGYFKRKEFPKEVKFYEFSSHVKCESKKISRRPDERLKEFLVSPEIK